MTSSLRRCLLAVAAAALLASACGTSAAPPAPSTGQDAKPDAKVEVANCGRQQTFPAPPKRILSLNQHATEILVALGLTDRIIGTAYPDTPDVPPAIAADYAKVKVVADKYPSVEQSLATEPDLVVGGYASAFSEKEGRGRANFETKGIRTLLLSESCPDKDGKSNTNTGTKSSLLTYTGDLIMFGQVFGIKERATKLADQTEAKVEAVTKKVREAKAEPVPVFFYDSGEQAPSTAGGMGMANDLAERAGGRNIFADVLKTFGDASWEQVAERAPKVVVIIDYVGSDGVAAKTKYLKAHPLASKTPAVTADRFVTLTLPDLIEGIRLAEAVEKLAKGLHPDLFR